MCHTKFPKSINSQESVIPDVLPEIADISRHNEHNIDGYIITIEGRAVIYFTPVEAYKPNKYASKIGYDFICSMPGQILVCLFWRGSQ